MPFNNLLKWVAAFGEENKYNAFDFYALVNHGALLDIKREKSWIAAMSITYPGSISSEVLYNGEIFTPEQLGNYLYGYADCFPLWGKPLCLEVNFRFRHLAFKYKWRKGFLRNSTTIITYVWG